MMAGNSAKSNFITLSSHSLDYLSDSESDYYTSDTLIMAADQPTKLAKELENKKLYLKEFSLHCGLTM